MGVLGCVYSLLIAFVAYGKFFVITDLHYDILYDGRYNQTYLCHERKTFFDRSHRIPTDDVRPVVREKCDCSLEMISVALQKMKIVEPEPEFILVLGDIVGHFTSSYLNEDGRYDIGYNIKLIEQTHKDVAELMRKFFPNTQIIPMIGNNDAYLDYVMPVGPLKKIYLEFLYELWGPLVGDLSEVFLEHGYYNATTKDGKTILVLNSILLSSSQKLPSFGQSEQFSWLENQLLINDNIFIVLHIPPGMGLYNGGSESWREEYVLTFKSIISPYSSKIKAILSGHYHSGVFQIINEIPIITNPSISPIFGGNPGFRLYDLENSNYFDYVLDSYNYTGTWYSTSFTSEYGFPLNFDRLLISIQTGLTSVTQFLEASTGWWIYTKPSFQDMCKPIFNKICSSTEDNLRKVIVCSIKYQLRPQFEECKIGLIKGNIHN